MNKFLILFSLSVLTVVFITAFIPSAEEQGIYDGIIRLHVIANSDSEEDQELKLDVRDAILDRIGEIVGDCTNVDQAYSAIDSCLPELKTIAQSAVNDKGYTYGVEAYLTYEYYPTKEYEEVTLPSGEYRSLRVIIGEGEGHNWWCVLYPPLCTGSASAKEELAQTGFTPNQIRLITDSEDTGYRVRFKITEVLSDIRYKLKKLFS